MNFKPAKKDLIKIILTYFCIFVILEILFYSFVNYQKSNIIKSYLNDYTKNITKQIIQSQNDLNAYARLVFENNINNQEIIDIIAKASNSKDNEELSLLRAKLYNKLLPTYKTLTSNDISQLHFHLPDTTSFLRFHDPSKYGDKLKKIRETLNFVNKNQISISAFEVGRILNAFRNVFPLYKNNKLIGTVEISSSFDQIKKNYLKVYKTSLNFILKETIIENKTFDELKKFYNKSEYKSYLNDTQLTNIDNMQLSLKEIKAIDITLSNDVESRLEENLAFSVLIERNKYSQIVTYIPLNNIDGKIFAYIIHYSFNEFLNKIKSNYYVSLSIFSLINISLFVLIIMSYKQKIKLIQAKKISQIDALTSIYNRLGIDRRIEEELERHKRYKDNTTIIFFDIDYFKKVNDTYGHQIGDQILIILSQLVLKFLRKIDILGRWGGEEFIIILPNTNLEKASAVAEKLRITIEKYNFLEIGTLTCSFGVTSLLSNDNYDSVIKRVDSLLYKAKKTGRNKVISSK